MADDSERSDTRKYVRGLYQRFFGAHTTRREIIETLVADLTFQQLVAFLEIVRETTFMVAREAHVIVTPAWFMRTWSVFKPPFDAARTTPQYDELLARVRREDASREEAFALLNPHHLAKICQIFSEAASMTKTPRDVSHRRAPDRMFLVFRYWRNGIPVSS